MACIYVPPPLPPIAVSRRRASDVGSCNVHHCRHCWTPKGRIRKGAMVLCISFNGSTETRLCPDHALALESELRRVGLGLEPRK